MTDECKYSMLPDEQGRECSEHGTIDSACREIADLKAKRAEAEKMAESGSMRRRLQVENADLQKRVRDLESELAESVACYEVEKKRATDAEKDAKTVEKYLLVYLEALSPLKSEIKRLSQRDARWERPEAAMHADVVRRQGGHRKRPDGICVGCGHKDCLCCDKCCGDTRCQAGYGFSCHFACVCH